MSVNQCIKMLLITVTAGWSCDTSVKLVQINQNWFERTYSMGHKPSHLPRILVPSNQKI